MTTDKRRTFGINAKLSFISNTPPVSYLSTNSLYFTTDGCQAGMLHALPVDVHSVQLFTNSLHQWLFLHCFAHNKGVGFLLRSSLQKFISTIMTGRKPEPSLAKAEGWGVIGFPWRLTSNVCRFYQAQSSRFVAGALTPSYLHHPDTSGSGVYSGQESATALP